MTILSAALILAVSCSQVLVFTSGLEMPVCGMPDLSSDTVIFSSADGRVYSVARGEIAGLKDPDEAPASQESTGKAATGPGRSISVTPEEKQRLLDSLSKSRGTPRPAGKLPPAPVEDLRADREIEVSGGSDERLWRERARAADERLLRAREELELLLRRERQLEDELLGLRSLGFRDNQFSYQIFQLQLTRDSMDRARLEIRRADRARFQLMEDARKEGILPGWLR